ncbi:MAG TPA: RraA family protein [Chloroflexota bacterium]|nr:RraA family protein [Chloroflexota bacterium]
MPGLIANPPERIQAFSSQWSGDRFPDGRPRVPDEILERMKLVTTEEAWGVLRRHDYHFQFAGGWLNMHPDRVLVGRAVTAVFMPTRPDIQTVIQEQGQAEGRVGGQNSWVIDTLVPGDVIVVDLFGKVKNGTFAGDNLGTSIHAKTGIGMVIDGGIRDVQRLYEIPDFAIFVRGLDPSAIAEVALMGINVPVRIGEVTILPGDVILGTREGLIAIPPHLAQEVVERSEDIRLRDEFGHQRLREGKYTPGEIDRRWSEAIEADFLAWRRAREA